jgi:hypothetical protein
MILSSMQFVFSFVTILFILVRGSVTGFWITFLIYMDDIPKIPVYIRLFWQLHMQILHKRLGERILSSKQNHSTMTLFRE